MKKILHILSSLKRNGTETFVMNLFRNIDKTYYMFDFVIFSDKKEGFYEEIKSLGGKVFFIPSRRENPYLYKKALKEFFRLYAKDYDAVHMHGMSLTSIAPLIYAKENGISKRIFHIHGTSCQGLHNKLFHIYNRYRIKKYATNFLGCSYDALLWGYGSLLKEGKIVTNGININQFSFDNQLREKTRRHLNLTNKRVILHVGSFNRIKNHVFLLDVFNSLVHQKKDFILICVGDGPLFEQIQEYAKKIGIADKVIFTGRQNNVNQFYQAADYLVMPSLHEGLPYSLVEAQSSGLNIITSCGISSEAKINENYKTLPLTLSPSKWAEVINNLSADERVKNINTNNLYNFSINTTLQEIKEIYGKPI